MKVLGLLAVLVMVQACASSGSGGGHVVGNGIAANDAAQASCPHCSAATAAQSHKHQGHKHGDGGTCGSSCHAKSAAGAHSCSCGDNCACGAESCGCEAGTTKPAKKSSKKKK